MPVNRYYSSTAVETTVSSPISSGAASVVVGSIAGFPVSTPFTIIFEVGTSNEEIAEVTNVAGTTFTITRGVDGSSALSHTSGAKVVHGVSARDFRETQEHMAATVGVHGLGGSTSVVGNDTVQTLTNKTLSSPVINTPTVTGGTWTGASIPSPTITTPTITTPTINSGGTWNGSPTLVTPTIASHTNAQHDHSSAAQGGAVPQASITGLAARLTTIEGVNTTQDGTLATLAARATALEGNWPGAWASYNPGPDFTTSSTSDVTIGMTMSFTKPATVPPNATRLVIDVQWNARTTNDSTFWTVKINGVDTSPAGQRLAGQTTTNHLLRGRYDILLSSLASGLNTVTFLVHVASGAETVSISSGSAYAFVA